MAFVSGGKWWTAFRTKRQRVGGKWGTAFGTPAFGICPIQVMIAMHAALFLFQQAGALALFEYF